MNKVDLIEDEELIIIDGGEMPEVTFYSSIYYLTKDQDGPKIELENEDLLRLKKAVIGCYRRIILRDLALENRDKGLYRGVERCRVNWERLTKFCQSEGLNFEHIREEIVISLKNFMAKEVAEVRNGERCSSINCSCDAFYNLLENLKLDSNELPDGWQKICP